MQFAKRLEKIPPYLFAEIVHKQNELVAKGVDIINIAVGDRDKATPSHILQVMHEAIHNAANHNYPPYQGFLKNWWLSASSMIFFCVMTTPTEKWHMMAINRLV